MELTISGIQKNGVQAVAKRKSFHPQTTSIDSHHEQTSGRLIRLQIGLATSKKHRGTRPSRIMEQLLKPYLQTLMTGQPNPSPNATQSASPPICAIRRLSIALKNELTS